VFRNGSIFDTLTDADVDPRLILEAMFGQTRGPRATAKAVGATPLHVGRNVISAAVHRTASQSATPIRIVTSNDAPSLEPKAPALDPAGRAIKIKYF
jgi:hypothetical protein